MAMRYTCCGPGEDFYSCPQDCPETDLTEYEEPPYAYTHPQEHEVAWCWRGVDQGPWACTFPRFM